METKEEESMTLYQRIHKNSRTMYRPIAEYEDVTVFKEGSYLVSVERGKVSVTRVDPGHSPIIALKRTEAKRKMISRYTEEIDSTRPLGIADLIEALLQEIEEVFRK